MLDSIVKPENLKQLLFYVTNDGADLEEVKRYKFPYVASEIYACDIWSLYEGTVKDTALMQEFWKFLDRDPPLNPLTASYFCKVNMILLQKVTKEASNTNSHLLTWLC